MHIDYPSCLTEKYLIGNFVAEAKFTVLKACTDRSVIISSVAGAREARDFMLRCIKGAVEYNSRYGTGSRKSRHQDGDRLQPQGTLGACLWCTPQRRGARRRRRQAHWSAILVT